MHNDATSPTVFHLRTRKPAPTAMRSPPSRITAHVSFVELRTLTRARPCYTHVMSASTAWATNGGHARTASVPPPPSAAATTVRSATSNSKTPADWLRARIACACGSLELGHRGSEPNRLPLACDERHCAPPPSDLGTQANFRAIMMREPWPFPLALQNPRAFRTTYFLTCCSSTESYPKVITDRAGDYFGLRKTVLPIPPVGARGTPLDDISRLAAPATDHIFIIADPRRRSTARCEAHGARGPSRWPYARAGVQGSSARRAPRLRHTRSPEEDASARRIGAPAGAPPARPGRWIDSNRRGARVTTPSRRRWRQAHCIGASFAAAIAPARRMLPIASRPAPRARRRTLRGPSAPMAEASDCLILWTVPSSLAQ